MSEEAGFKIGQRFYPFPTGFYLGDPVLVEKLTELKWSEFVERLPDDEAEQAPDDPVVMLGLIGVAISQANQAWSRAKVIQFTTRLKMDTIEFVGPELEQPEDDARPPELATTPSPGENMSDPSPPTSRSDSAFPSEPSSPETSGAPTSVTSREPSGL